MLSIQNVCEKLSKLPIRTELQTQILKRSKPERINDYITNTDIEVVRPCHEDGKESFTKKRQFIGHLKVVNDKRGDQD